MGDAGVVDLSGDVGVVRRYGREHPNTYGDLWVSDGRLQVGMTADLELHAARLQASVVHPELMDVVRVRWTLAHLEEVCAEVEKAVAAHRGLLHSVGLTRQRVQVGLRADGVAVAADLHARFGDAVDTSVGLWRYPTGPDGSRAMEPPTATGAADGIDLWLRLDSEEVRSGADLAATLVAHNTGLTTVRMRYGDRLRATVLDRDGAVAGVITGFQQSVEHTAVAEPDRIVYFPVVVGTAGVEHYATPPGRYRVVVDVDVANIDGSEPRRLVSPPVPLVVVG